MTAATDRTEEFTNAARGAATALARKHFFLGTVETRDTDWQALQLVSAWDLREALIAAFIAGAEYALSPRDGAK